jgi:RND family efflux transporter MFP subunit
MNRKLIVNRLSTFLAGSAICLVFAFGPLTAAAEARPPVSCLIEPDRIVRLSTPVAGIVADVAVDRGDLVSAGQVVATLEDDIERLAVESARLRAEDDSTVAGLEARIAFLTDQAERNARLARSNAVAATTAKEAELERDIALQDLERARLDRNLARLALRDAEARVAQKTLRSPISGVVVERLLNPGEYRDGQSHIATIARLSTLRVEAFLPIAYLDAISVGQKVRILPESPFDDFHEARIAVVDRVFDAATATVGIRIDLPNAALALPAGLRCEVHFD